MNYRDDFYIEKNIIGYTGALTGRELPTIYFYDNLESAFGCITQFHSNTSNIGRHPVRQDRNYLIFNSAHADPILQSTRILGTPPIFLQKKYLDIIIKSAADITQIKGNRMLECYQFGVNEVVKHTSRFEFTALNKDNNIDKDLLIEMAKNYLELKPRFMQNIVKVESAAKNYYDFQGKRIDKFYGR
ncbi:MAG: hypothetical protein KAH18_01910 [Psychromonas sp.]|nr:hypothetical protein [Psychromonas sp.]